MNFLSVFKAIIGGDPLQGITKLINAVHPSPEEKAQAQAIVAQIELQSDQLQAARDEALEQYEATIQNDPAWKKAHAFFVYIVDVALLFNLLLIPIFNIATHKQVAYIPLPSDVMHLFEITFVGFAGVIHGPDIITAIRGDK